jgi:hypothetical protein
VRGYCGRIVQFSSLDTSVTASLTDLSVQLWFSSLKLRAVPPAGSRARPDRPDRRSVHTGPHVSREFVDHCGNVTSVTGGVHDRFQKFVAVPYSMNVCLGTLAVLFKLQASIHTFTKYTTSWLTCCVTIS